MKESFSRKEVQTHSGDSEERGWAIVESRNSVHKTFFYESCYQEEKSFVEAKYLIVFTSMRNSRGGRGTMRRP